MSEELKSIVEDLGSRGRMTLVDGATEEQIAQFENEHDILLPQKFKEWLVFSDGGYCFQPAGLQIYGVAHKPILNVDDNDRPNDNYIVIGTLCYGDPILCEKSSEKVCIYNHESGIIEEDETYLDFFEFLKDLPSILGID